MSQTIYGGPSDDWVSRTTMLREVDGRIVAVVEVVMRGSADVVTFATPPSAAEPERPIAKVVNKDARKRVTR